MRGARLFLSLLLALISFGTALSAQESTLRRFALIAGANDGGYQRVTLRYAASDAETFAAVMTSMGGVRPQDTILLLNPDFVEFQDGLREVKTRIKAAKGEERTELVVYYSGHSDEQGLLLGRERFTYTRLRREISDAEADVRVAVLDSCSSGTITRTKGGTRQPAFLLDVSNETEGYAFLTSSSEDELAQESDRIGGSFFTHYLVSGLRGAADTSGDSLVTLNEAYNYAFTETLASTEGTRYGPQHASYDINLTGTGDLVLTDMRQTTGLLVVDAGLKGKLFVREPQGRLIAEINKREGEETRMGLEAGVYALRIQDGEQNLEGRVVVGSGGPTRVDANMFSRIGREPTVARGSVGLDPAGPGGGEERPIHFSVLPEMSLDQGPFNATETHTVSLNLLIGNAAAIEAVQASLIGNVVADKARGVQFAGVGNAVGQDLYGYQQAGIINYAGRDVSGAHTAGVVNFTRGSVLGGELAGVMNLAYGGLDGAQVAGVGNISGERTRGTQVAGLFNYSSEAVDGSQIAGAINIGGDVQGLQLAGLANYGLATIGAQISLLNISRQITGAQVGLVNTTREITGTQIGLINISERMNGIPIGLINFEKEGSQHTEFWWQGNDSYNVGLRFGAGFLYTLIRGGYVRKSDPAEWSVGAGMGLQIPLQPFFVNVDGSVTQTFTGSESPEEWDPASLTPAIRITGGFSPNGGFGVLFGGILEMEVPGWQTSSRSPFRMSARPYIGIQFGNPGHRGKERPSGPWEQVDWDKKAEEWEKKAEEWAKRFDEKQQEKAKPE